jgi:hypothetical protein
MNGKKTTTRKGRESAMTVKAACLASLACSLSSVITRPEDGARRPSVEVIADGRSVCSLSDSAAAGTS